MFGQAKCDIATDNASLGQRQSKMIAFSLKFSWNVDQSKPDSHYDSQFDPYISCILVLICLQQNATQILGGDRVPSPLKKLAMYKCLVAAQNRLPNALVEEVGESPERLNIFRVRQTN